MTEGDVMMQAHDIRASLDGLGELDFRPLAPFNRGMLGVFWSSGGTSPWERHPDDEELLQPIEGEVDIEVLTETGPVVTTVRAGAVFVVPRGHWHRHRHRGLLKELFLTPGPTEHSTAADPRQAPSPPPARPQAIDLASTYVQLDDGPEAREVPVGPDFWETIAQRADLHGGRLVVVAHNAADWPTWEMHPAGEEVVYLLSGTVDLVLAEPDGERAIALCPGQAVVVPRGVWHRAIVHQPGDTLHVTRGAGTQHRPR
jgi:quercetin dioxygenase-like cupin family protein